MYITAKSSIGDFAKRGDYYHDSVGKLLSVNVAGDTDSTIHMSPITCRYNCPDLLDACEDEDFVRKWTDPNTWTQQEWFLKWVVTPPVMFFSKCQHIAQDAIADIFSL